MGSLSMKHMRWIRSHSSTSHLHLLCPVSTSIRANFIGVHDNAKLHHDLKFSTRTSARRKSVKKLKRDEQSRFSEASNVFSNGSTAEDGSNQVSSVEIDNFSSQKLPNVPSRSSVLQACTVTSGFIAALGLIIRQVSHAASVEGLPIPDCSTGVSFGFETWHLELITGLVLLISSCRYLLLKTWPDFAESSEAANQQVLASLEPLDYLIVALLPGVSEELLFRGALLPLFGANWTSVLVVATIFGVLHLGSGRKYSFAVWATFVGFLYGYATIVSKSIIVPMASHSLNNLVGGILWRYTSKSLK